jgi:DNA-binding SARP family transcriptional activator
MIEIRCFGQFEVKRDGETLSDLADWKGRTRNIKLLKILLTPPAKHCTTGELIDLLWPDEKRTQVNTANRSRQVRSAVAELRKILEPALENSADSQFIKSPPERQGYFLNCESPDCHIDTLAFLAFCKAAKDLAEVDQWDEAERQSKRAIELYRGEYLEEDRYEEWSFEYREELRTEASDANVLLADCYSKKENFLSAVACIQEAIKQNPSREDELEKIITEYRLMSTQQKRKTTAEPVSANLAPEINELTKVPSKVSRTYWAIGGLALAAIFLYALLTNLTGIKSLEPVHNQSVVQFFQNDLDAFNFAADFPPIMVDFEDLEGGADITGKAFNGVRFEKKSPSGAPLIVVKSDETVTPEGFRCEPLGDPAHLKLLPTSGGKVLSPGGTALAPGPDPALEDDDLVMIFEKPVAAVGLDLLWQAIGNPVRIVLQDTRGKIIDTEEVSLSLGTIGVAPPSGNMFVGFRANEKVISKVIVDESDNDSCHQDANIGYDTIRFAAAEKTDQTTRESYLFERQWGSKGIDPGQFNTDAGPRGIAIVNKDQARIYVSDYTNGRIQLFQPDGRLMGIFAIEFVPQDIEYDGHGAFYARGIDGILGSGGGLAKLDMNMNVLWTTQAPAAGWTEYGLCLDSEGNIHVPTAPSTKPGQSRMRKYDPSGNLLLEYGHGLVSGSDRCESSPEGFLYVTDSSSSNLRKFGNDGRLLDTIKIGYGINGIAISKDGSQIFLAIKVAGESKTMIPKIRKYDKDFYLLAEWGGLGEGNGSFSNNPEDLELDGDGNVYATDGKNFLIQVFRPIHP